MNNNTLRATAQSVLLMAYGGKLKHDEMGFTEAQVARWLCEWRDFFLKQDIMALGDSMQPDMAYFSIYYDVEILWGKGYGYILLPNGLPPSCPFNRGVRIEPSMGGGMPFIVTMDNFCNLNPHLAFLEGNYACEVRPDRVLFTNMEQSTAPRTVTLYVIEKSSGDMDKPLNIPPDKLSACADKVLERMGLSRQDNSADNIETREGK